MKAVIDEIFFIEALKPTRVIFQSLATGDRLCNPSGQVRTFNSFSEADDYLKTIKVVLGIQVYEALSISPNGKEAEK